MQPNPANIRHPSVLALGYSEAAMLLRSGPPPDVKALISIHGNHEFPLDALDITNRLILHFDDVEAVDMTDSVNGYATWARQKWAAEMGRPVSPPEIKDAQAIIHFARALMDLEGTVLCQCQGGVSRSPAAALLCLATWTGEGQERYCVEQVQRIRPCDVAHRDLISFGDILLGRNGKLVQAAAEARQRMA
jgi:predicted protein tyrosine phosphatase